MGFVAEKGSCRWLHNRTRLLKEDMCGACNEHSRWSDTKLARNKASVVGCCSRLYYANGSPIVVRPSTANQHSSTSPQVTGATSTTPTGTRTSTRTTKSPTIYDATPASESNMFVSYNSSLSHQSSTKCSVPSCNCKPEAVVNRLVKEGGGKVNKSRGGTSKSAINKQKQHEAGALEGKQEPASACTLVMYSNYPFTNLFILQDCG